MSCNVMRVPSCLPDAADHRQVTLTDIAYILSFSHAVTTGNHLLTMDEKAIIPKYIHKFVGGM